jgi:hypothetical protein
MATFTKLFVMRMVASICFGIFMRPKVIKADLLLSFFNSSFSEGLNEKYAASDPEISAEQIRRIPRAINEKMKLVKEYIESDAPARGSILDGSIGLIVDN